MARFHASQLVRRHWVPIAIAVSGTLVCAGLTWMQWTTIRTQRELDFKEAVYSRWDAFRVEVKRAEDLQDTIVAFLETSGDLGPHHFESFAAKLPSVKFQAVSFAPYVAAAERAAFERSVRAQGWPVTHIWERDRDGTPQPAAYRDAHFPVTYLYPRAGNSSALGFDLASESRRRRALFEAIKTGSVVRTEPIKLVQDPDHWAFLVFKPVYTRQSRAAFDGIAPPELLGVVSTVYQYRTLLDAVLPRTGIAAQHVALFDVKQSSAPVHMHYSGKDSANRPNLDRPLAALAADDALRPLLVVSMSEEELSAVFVAAEAGPAWWRQINATIFATLGIGLLLTGALVWNQLRSYRLTVRLNEARDHLKIKKEEAETANAAKSGFLAAASHDLRQPMYALQLFAEALESEVGHPERSRLLIHRLHDSIAAMSAILNALLDISSLEAGTLNKVVQEFPVQRLLQRVESIYAPVAVERGLRLSVVNSTAWIRSDPDLLGRVVDNLVSNAIKYTRRGGVLVGCRRRAAVLSIQVWDTGVGIPSEHHTEIFTEFFQLHNPERDRRKGLGLGLAIVKRITRLLDHSLRMTSVMGHGSMFAVDVPYGERRHARPMSGTVEETVNRFADVRVAVIDDEADIVDATKELLERWGCIVVVAKSGSGMLDALNRRSLTPDILLCDYQLSEGENGLSAIDRIRMAHGKTIPAIVVSGNPVQGLVKAAERIGMLQKPVAPAKLRAAMQRLLLQK